jgi:hypothetical protein
MTRTSIILSIGALFLFTGCVEVTFPEPMPMNRKDKTHFPNSWLGEWTFAKQSDELEENLTIHSQYITFGDETMVLGTENILRKFAGYYILNTKGGDSDRWSLLLAKRSKDVLHIYKFDGTDDEKAAIWKDLLDDDDGRGFEVVKKKDGASEKIREYKLNPRNNRSLRELLKKGGLSYMGDYVR